MLTVPELPADLPRPEDDGACAHLSGMQLPDISLHASDGRLVNLSRLPGRTVIYCYPRMGQPGLSIPEAWNRIPGARGCTTQSCSFRDHYDELAAVGVSQLFGLSTQDIEYLREAVDRLHLPFPLLSDEEFQFADALKLPRFEFNGLTLLKRLTLIVDEGVVKHVFYPVFPPDRSAQQTLEWLRLNRTSQTLSQSRPI